MSVELGETGKVFYTSMILGLGSGLVWFGLVHNF